MNEHDGPHLFGLEPWNLDDVIGGGGGIEIPAKRLVVKVLAYTELLAQRRVVI